jgi:hypothetical protein
MDARGPDEARLLGVERGLEAMDSRLRALRRRAIALGQGIWDAWSDETATMGVPMCTASYSGTLLSCTSTGLVGQVVTVMAGGVPIGYATSTTGGAFSGSVMITSPTQAVTFTTAAFTGYAASSLAKTLSCGSNSVGNFHPTPIVNAGPTINSLSSNTTSVCGTPGATVVNLSGITDGMGGTELPITIIATSSNTALIPNPTVSYTSPNTTGTLTYTPNAGVYGSATLVAFVQNAGPTTCGGTNSTFSFFSVTIGEIIGPPTVTGSPTSLSWAINSGATFTISATGIGFGPNPGGAATTLSLSCVSSNPGLVPSGTVTYTSPNTTGSVVVGPPVANASGSGHFSLTVTTNAPHPVACTTITQTFLIPYTIM